MSVSLMEPPVDKTVDHALLVPIGRLLEELGLMKAFEAGAGTVERKGGHGPAKKLTQVVLGICAGNRTMTDFEEAGRPLARNLDLLEACGFEDRWAHTSRVCSFLRDFEWPDVVSLEGAIRERFRPELATRVERSIRTHGMVVVDLDLNGLPTTGEARTFTGTEFGHLRGKLACGYQIAAAVLDVEVSERWLLTAKVLGGKGKAPESVPLLIADIEAMIGRPRRRVEAMRERLDAMREHRRDMEREEERMAREIEELDRQTFDLEVELEILERQKAKMEPRGMGLARRRQIEKEQETARRQLGRVSRGIQQRRRRAQSLKSRRERLEVEDGALAARLSRYEQDNEENPSPVPILLRGDSAFGTSEVLDDLYERGYELVTKTASGGQNASFFAAVPEDRRRAVGPRAWAAEHPTRRRVGRMSYDLRLMAYERVDVDGKRYRAIIATTLARTEAMAPQVVRRYNGRQHIEATFDETRNVLEFGRPRLRRHEANAVFALMVLVSYNLLRLLVTRTVRTVKRRAASGLSFLVRVLAHAPAVIQILADRVRLVFAKASAYHGQVFEMLLGSTSPP